MHSCMWWRTKKPSEWWYKMSQQLNGWVRTATNPLGPNSLPFHTQLVFLHHLCLLVVQEWQLKPCHCSLSQRVIKAKWIGNQRNIIVCTMGQCYPLLYCYFIVNSSPKKHTSLKVFYACRDPENFLVIFHRNSFENKTYDSILAVGFHKSSYFLLGFGL